MKLMTMRLTFDVLMLAFFVFAFAYATGFRALAKTFPMTAAGAGIVFTSLLLIRDVVGAVQVSRDEKMVLPEHDHTATLIQAAQERGAIGPALRGFTRQGAWIAGFLLLVWMLSMPVGSVIYVLLFLRLEARMRWRAVMIGAAATFVALVVMAEVMDLAFPPSLWEPLGRWIG